MANIIDFFSQLFVLYVLFIVPIIG